MLRRLAALLLLSSSLSAAACSPVTRGPASDGGTGPVVSPIQPTPIKPVAPKLDRAKVRAALAARRDVTVGRFLAYREGRVYPVNDVTPGAQHIWLDSLGNLCAAATIIAGDWGYASTAGVAQDDNFIALADVTDGPLADWILTSGLARHEIVAIQVPPMMPEPEWQPNAEVERLYNMYVDVERQLRGLWDESLELATDALMARPDLARGLLAGAVAGPGRYEVTLEPAAMADARGFAQPPPR